MVRWLLAAVHLLALGIGLGSVWARARLLWARRRWMLVRRFGGRWRPISGGGVGRDPLGRLGLWRLLAGTEKPTAYYLENHAFWTKMALFAAILVLESTPIVTLGAWRRQLAKGETPDLRAAPGMARTSYVQAVLVILMVLAATAMARGLG